VPEHVLGTQDRLVQVPVDDEITTWLNTIDDAGESVPPAPNPEAWQWFTMPSADPSVVFDTGIETNLDVLEILSYPDGLDEAGVPVSIEVHPLCGPQADETCLDAAWGKSGVRISLAVVERAIRDTEYYALGGIMLPIGDSHPDSFMVLMRYEQARESR
jgi:hypothetical protein